MRGREVFVGALLVVGVVGTTSSATARDVSLEYVAAEGCPNEAWLRAEVAARLGRDPFVDERAETNDPSAPEEGGALVARVVSERHAAGWRGSLELRRIEPRETTPESSAATGSLGRRVLDDDDCRELTATLALSLAMTLDTLAHGEESPTASSGAADGPGATTNEPSSVTATTEGSTRAPRELVLRFEVADEDEHTRHATSDAASDTRPDVRGVETPRSLHVVARGGVTLGLRPDLAPRVELGLALRHARFVLELGGAFGPQTRSDVAGRSLRTRDGELQVAPCLRAFEVWDVCGVVGLGRLAVVASDDRSPRAWTASLGVRTEAAWPLGRIGAPVALTLALDVRANLRRPSVISGDETLWRAAPVRGAFVLGLRWRFAAWTESRGRAQAARRRDDDAVGRRVQRARTGAPWTTRSGA